MRIESGSQPPARSPSREGGGAGGMLRNAPRTGEMDASPPVVLGVSAAGARVRLAGLCIAEAAVHCSDGADAWRARGSGTSAGGRAGAGGGSISAREGAVTGAGAANHESDGAGSTTRCTGAGGGMASTAAGAGGDSEGGAGVGVESCNGGGGGGAGSEAASCSDDAEPNSTASGDAEDS
jgi:hypothetical protein